MLLNTGPERRIGELLVQTREEKNFRTLEIEASVISTQTGFHSQELQQ